MTFVVMLNLVSIVIGLVALVPVLLALLPFFGWANWFILPLPVLGVIVGSLGEGKTGRNLNIVLVVIAIGRLMLGGGLF